MALILGKRVFGRRETLEYADYKFGWDNFIVGISCFYGFWAWLLARLTNRKCIYYCIDFYSPEIAENLWDLIFIYSAMKMDKFLLNHVDEVWDISDRIKIGRWRYGKYWRKAKVVPLSYPPKYFRYQKNVIKDKIVFVGVASYGLELLSGIPYTWLGKDDLLPIEVLLYDLSKSGIGISMWEKDGNNFYGDPGKTKLYSACGLPVIMTDNTPYAEIIKLTRAGLVIPYNKESLQNAIKEILDKYDYYKDNVKKTWEYLDADKIFRDMQILER